MKLMESIKWTNFISLILVILTVVILLILLNKVINLKILRNIIKNNPLKKEKTISEQILNNKNNIIYPDSDLINVIDTPHIVLNDKNNISFINNATKKNLI